MAVEVQGPDGKAYRFASGTKAGFAVERILARLGNPSAEVLCIEAICEGQEPVEFGPDADLASYGDGWTLRTVSQQPDGLKSRNDQPKQVDATALYPGGNLPRGRKAEFTLEYVGNVVLCFLCILLLGVILKTFLEQLPSLLSSYNYVSNDTHEL